MAFKQRYNSKPTNLKIHLWNPFKGLSTDTPTTQVVDYELQLTWNDSTVISILNRMFKISDLTWGCTRMQHIDKTMYSRNFHLIHEVQAFTRKESFPAKMFVAPLSFRITEDAMISRGLSEMILFSARRGIRIYFLKKIICTCGRPVTGSKPWSALGTSCGRKPWSPSSKKPWSQLVEECKNIF